MDLCQNNLPIINFTTDDMTSKFELFSKKKMNGFYLTEKIGYICYMDTGMKEIHPNEVIFISGLSGCFNIIMKCL